MTLELCLLQKERRFHHCGYRSNESFALCLSVVLCRKRCRIPRTLERMPISFCSSNCTDITLALLNHAEFFKIWRAG